MADPKLTIHCNTTRLTFNEDDDTLSSPYYTLPERQTMVR